MTSWIPDLTARNGPRYRAIAEALAEDVRGGRLAAGTQLPTQRDLAWKLHVTIGTVGEGAGGSVRAASDDPGASQPSDFGSDAAKKSTISK